jgi:hypothetical protein
MDKATTKVWEAITALFLLKSSRWVQPLAHGKVSYWWLIKLKKILKWHEMAFKAAAVIMNILNHGVWGLKRENADINNQLILCGAFAAASEALPKSTTDQTSEQVSKRPRLSSESDEDMKSVIQVRMRDHVQHMRAIRKHVYELGCDIEDTPSFRRFGKLWSLQHINTEMIWIETDGLAGSSWLTNRAAALGEFDLQSVRKEHWIIVVDSDEDSDDEMDRMPSCCEERWSLSITPLGYVRVPPLSFFNHKNKEYE